MILARFENPYRLANTYVVDIGNDNVVLVDIGNLDLDFFSGWIKTNNKTIAAVFLTHEHSDHCNGVDALHSSFDYELYCSVNCEKNIRDSKQNFSRYIEEMPTMTVETPATVVADRESIVAGNKEFTFFYTPGHSPGGVCIVSEGKIFTGDTLLNGIKTPLSFPHSNREDYKKSIQIIKGLVKPGMEICPGHGEPFIYRSFDELVY